MFTVFNVLPQRVINLSISTSITAYPFTEVGTWIPYVVSGVGSSLISISITACPVTLAVTAAAVLATIPLIVTPISQ